MKKLNVTLKNIKDFSSNTFNVLFFNPKDRLLLNSAISKTITDNINELTIYTTPDNLKEIIDCIDSSWYSDIRVGYNTLNIKFYE